MTKSANMYTRHCNGTDLTAMQMQAGSCRQGTAAAVEGQSLTVNIRLCNICRWLPQAVLNNTGPVE